MGMGTGGNGFTGGQFRFRQDDGYENPASGTIANWLAAINTNISRPINAGPFRLRFAMQRNNLEPSADYQFDFIFSYNGASYGPITTTGARIRAVNSRWISHHDDTTAYTGADQVYANTWADTTNAAVITGTSPQQTGTSTWTVTAIAEGLSVEICLLCRPNLLSAGDYIDIRCRPLGVPPEYGWDYTPRINFTAAIQGAPQPKRIQVPREAEFRKRQKLDVVYGKKAPVQTPGWMEIIQQRTERYPELLARDVFDVREILRQRPSISAPQITVRAPGWMEAIYYRTSKLRSIAERGAIQVQWLVPQTEYVYGVAVPVVSGSDWGWLVSHMAQRAHGHNLRR